jgi:hypothetical protein
MPGADPFAAQDVHSLFDFSLEIMPHISPLLFPFEAGIRPVDGKPDQAGPGMVQAVVSDLMAGFLQDPEGPEFRGAVFVRVANVKRRLDSALPHPWGGFGPGGDVVIVKG